MVAWPSPSSTEKTLGTPCCLGGHPFCSLAAGTLETHFLKSSLVQPARQGDLGATEAEVPGHRGDGARPLPREKSGGGCARQEAAPGQRRGQEPPLPPCSWLRCAPLGVERGMDEDPVGGT